MEYSLRHAVNSVLRLPQGTSNELKALLRVGFDTLLVPSYNSYLYACYKPM